MRLFSLSLLGALAGFGLAGDASAAPLAFPDLILPAGPPDVIYTTATASNLGPLQSGGTLSFTLTTEGETWLSDLTFSLADPGGSTARARLPNAPDAPGDYSGAIGFATTAPGSGIYALSFANTFGTAFDVRLSNIRLDVSPAPVPEPAALTVLGGGVLTIARRRPRRRASASPPFVRE